MRQLSLIALAVVALAGCGEDIEPIRGGAAPAVTSPGTTNAYETGGADGSGADGRETASPRGGVGGGHDSREPGTDPGADNRFSPPRGKQDQP